jgi:hypothetical protein
LKKVEKMKKIKRVIIVNKKDIGGRVDGAVVVVAVLSLFLLNCKLLKIV